MSADQDLTPLLSPLDGRYRETTAPLATWLSEEGINQGRIEVECSWIVFALNEGLIPGQSRLSEDQIKHLRSLNVISNRDERDRLATLEAETRHDVKAVEYLVREHLEKAPNKDLSHLVELVHFLCTSEDINNLAYALSVREAVKNVWLPAARQLAEDLGDMASKYANVAMLARTHGQPATPTTLGKELKVFSERMKRVLGRVENAEYTGKFNGATGTYSAHVAVLPDVDWQETSRSFVESLGLSWNGTTTQIEPHDWQIELYSAVVHFNRIAHNLATDCWSYISLGYFQQATEGTTGSSTMPHKVNPIRFENAEANMEMSDGIFETLSRSLATTRFQRDLSDSSLQRNIGIAFGYSLVAIDNLRRGLSRLGVNSEAMRDELERHPEVLSEVIQQALRLANLTAPGKESPAEGANESVEPYKLLKELTRGKQVTLEALQTVIRGANLSSDLEERLLAMSPSDYVGLAGVIASPHGD